MRETKRALLWTFGLLTAFASCGPLSSRTKAGHAGADAVGGAEGGQGERGGNTSAGTATNTAGKAAGGAAELGGGAGDAATMLGGAGGAGGAESDGGAAGAPEPDGPVTIATEQLTPTGIALDASYVYWANRDAGTIVKCPRRGCGTDAPTPVVASALGAPLGIAVDASSIYWVNAVDTGTGRIYKCPLSGCAGPPQLLTSWAVGNKTNGLHVVGQELYVAAWPLLGTCAITGCPTPTNIGGGPFVSVDTDAQFLYAGRYGGSELVRCPLAGCNADNSAAVTMASSVFALAVAVDESYIYFADHDYFSGAAPTKHQISKCPLDGCGAFLPELVLDGAISPYGLALNTTRLYFTNVTEGTVVSIPKDKD